MLTIWHNPRCTKSRRTLALIEASGKAHTVRRYLDKPPTMDEIAAMVEQLGLDDPRGLMRTNEAVYKTRGLKAVTAPEALLHEMAAHPILIERPVVSDGLRAVIGRPPENVTPLLDASADGAGD